MAAANYWKCSQCGAKVYYVGEDDTPDHALVFCNMDCCRAFVTAHPAHNGWRATFAGKEVLRADTRELALAAALQPAHGMDVATHARLTRATTYVGAWDNVYGDGWAVEACG